MVVDFVIYSRLNTTQIHKKKKHKKNKENEAKKRLGIRFYVTLSFLLYFMYTHLPSGDYNTKHKKLKNKKQINRGKNVDHLDVRSPQHVRGCVCPDPADHLLT